MSESKEPKWEPVATDTLRLAVPGGWLYKVVETAWDEHPSGENRRYANMAISFVPTPPGASS